MWEEGCDDGTRRIAGRGMMAKSLWLMAVCVMGPALVVMLGRAAAPAQGADAFAPGGTESGRLDSSRLRGGTAADESDRWRDELEALRISKKFFVRTTNLCKEERALDCQSQGITIASDGNCYFASSTHSGSRGAMVFKYDPVAAEVTRICDDISDVCRENPATQAPQGMLFTNPVEVDGWVYWGTHCAFSGAGVGKPYSGGHVVGYNLKTREWRDLGIPARGCAIFAGLAADAKNKRLFATATPIGEKESEATHLYRMDLPDGKWQDAGMVSYGGLVGYQGIWVDMQGRCWLAAAAGALLCYDPAANAMRGWLDAMPRACTDRGFPDPDASVQTLRMWDWVRPIPGQNQCLFTLKGGAGFYYFTPGSIGRGSGAPFGALRPLSGYTGQGCAVAEERIYFVRSVTLASAPGVSLLHLASIGYTDDKAEVADYGAIVDDKGRVPRRLESVAADSKGRVYMVGDWGTIAGDATSLVNRTNDPYLVAGRAQFFATGELPPEKAPFRPPARAPASR